jgi:hypothetical protein
VKSYLLLKGYKTLYSYVDNILNSTSYVSNTESGAGVYGRCNSSVGNAPISKIKERNLFSFEGLDAETPQFSLLSNNLR